MAGKKKTAFRLSEETNDLLNLINDFESVHKRAKKLFNRMYGAKCIMSEIDETSAVFKDFLYKEFIIAIKDNLSQHSTEI